MFGGPPRHGRPEHAAAGAAQSHPACRQHDGVPVRGESRAWLHDACLESCDSRTVSVRMRRRQRSASAASPGHARVASRAVTRHRVARGRSDRADRRCVEDRREDRPQHLRPVRRASRHGRLRGRLGRSRTPRFPTPAASATTSWRRSRRSRCPTCAGPAAASRTTTTGARALVQPTSAPSSSIRAGAASPSRTRSVRTSSWTSSARSAARPTSP